MGSHMSFPLETPSQGDILNPYFAMRQNKDFSLKAAPQTESLWMRPQESYEKTHALGITIYGLPGFYR